MTIQKTRNVPARPDERQPTPERRVSDSALDAAVGEVTRAWRRYALRFLRSPWNTPPTVVGITSATHGEGRTTGSLCMAISLAEESGAPVALLGLDCQGYGLAQAFGITDGPDLEGVLRGTWRPEAALSDVGIPGVAVLPASAGGRQRMAPRLFWPTLRRQLPDILVEFRRDYAYIVCDLPPLLDNADASDLVREMDAVLLVTRTGVTHLSKLEESLDLVDRERLAGAVHIGASTPLPKWLTALLLE